MAAPIVLQAAVPVLDDDTVETLSARILVEEHRLYPEAIRLMLDGGWRLKGGASFRRSSCRCTPGAKTAVLLRGIGCDERDDESSRFERRCEPDPAVHLCGELVVLDHGFEHPLDCAGGNQIRHASGDSAPSTSSFRKSTGWRSSADRRTTRTSCRGCPPHEGSMLPVSPPGSVELL